MKQSSIFKLAIKLLKQEAKSNPTRSFVNSEGERVTIKDVANELDKVSKWLYRGLSTEDIARVVRCKNCKYYKKHNKTDSLKGSSYYICSKDKQRRDPMFYCTDGEERL